MAQNNSIKAKIFFLVLGMAFVILPITPVNMLPTKYPLPDFLFCFIFVALVRNPKQVSIIAILFISLLADALWFRPLGLTTITYILASEILRRSLINRTKIGFFEEATYISGIFIVVTLFQEVIKFFTLIPSLILGDIITYIFFTLLLYFICTLTIRVSKLMKPLWYEINNG